MAGVRDCNQRRDRFRTADNGWLRTAMHFVRISPPRRSCHQTLSGLLQFGERPVSAGRYSTRSLPLRNADREADAFRSPGVADTQPSKRDRSGGVGRFSIKSLAEAFWFGERPVSAGRYSTRSLPLQNADREAQSELVKDQKPHRILTNPATWACFVSRSN